MEELLSLKWNNHRTSFLHLMSVLRKKNSYTDVTLACDGKLYNVHKMVLSASSDYFSNIFENISCPNPVIILKDMSASNLESLLDYMYLGEVNVKQANLASLIQAAECLQVKGLAVPDNDTPEKSDLRKRSSDSPPNVRKKPRKSILKDSPIIDNISEEPPNSTPSSLKIEDVIIIKEESDGQEEYASDWDYLTPHQNPCNPTDPMQLDPSEQPLEDDSPNTIFSPTFPSDDFHDMENSNSKPGTFDDPPHATSSSQSPRDTTIKLDKRMRSCKYCRKLFLCNTTLQRHERIHTGEKPFGCRLCPYKGNRKCNLRKHISTKHPDSLMSDTLIGPELFWKC